MCTHEITGSIALLRSGRPFDRDDGLVLRAFAEQAAIAIANAQLFNDLDASLDRQTAMTDLLDAVSTARLDLQPVFDTLAGHANRLVQRHRRRGGRPPGRRAAPAWPERAPRLSMSSSQPCVLPDRRRSR